jgi:RNA polymerase sigma factor (sigma-70 family)
MYDGEPTHQGDPAGGGGRARNGFPMPDDEIVAAIVARHPAGLAAAYDRYAPALHTYCHTLLGEPADAADAVQDTFVIAAAKVAGLRDPSRLRPWLYAVARNECRRRLRARSSAVPLEEAGEMTDGGPAVGADAERLELQFLVRAALAGLNPGEREVIELNLRHELDGADLADALGVPRNQAHALASRARSQFETSLGALLVARAGRGYCAELDGILEGWDGELTVLLRKRINRHIERCDVCGDRKRRELSPAMLLSLFPMLILPAGLRQQVLRLVADVSPDASAYCSRIAHRAEPFGREGFPEPLDPLRLPRGGNHAVTAAAAAAALLVLGGGGVFAARMLHGHPAASVAAADTPAASSTPAATSAPPSPSPSPSPSRQSTAPATPPAVVPVVTPTLPSPTPKQTPTKPKPKPTPTPTPTPGTLVASTASVTLAPSANGGFPYQGSFTLTAQGGPVKNLTITTDAPAGEYTISPAAGSIAAGGTLTVTLTTPQQPPTGAVYMTTLTIMPGGLTVSVTDPAVRLSAGGVQASKPVIPVRKGNDRAGY